jgi:hypothetical protein
MPSDDKPWFCMTCRHFEQLPPSVTTAEHKCDDGTMRKLTGFTRDAFDALVRTP